VISVIEYMDSATSRRASGLGFGQRPVAKFTRGSEPRPHTEEDPTIYLIDDDSRSLETLDGLLSSRGYRVRAFADPDEFLALPRPSGPACLILDLNLGNPDGLMVQQQLASDGSITIIFLSGIVDIPMAVKAMRGGASEVLLKPVNEEQIVRAVRVALKQAHKQWVDRQLTLRIRKNYSRLTPREGEVLPYIVRGFLNKQTAYELGTSEITIRIHRGQIMKKMQASSLADLVWLAGRLGIPDRTSNIEALLSARNGETEPLGMPLELQNHLVESAGSRIAGIEVPAP
jgi:FixJ family two-component response regulator